LFGKVDYKARSNNLLSTGDPSHRQKQTLTYGERLEEDLPSQWPLKQAGVAILISDKVDFKLMLIKQNKEGHSILIKEEINQKEIRITNLYALNVNAPNSSNIFLRA
jgi:hypothetical protein